MGFIKEAKSNRMAADARRAFEEGRRVFIVQLRGNVGHSPSLSRPIADLAEMIEAIEDEGWLMDQFTSVPYKDNMTTVCPFRRARGGHQPNGHQQQDTYRDLYRQQDVRPDGYRQQNVLPDGYQQQVRRLR